MSGGGLARASRRRSVQDVCVQADSTTDEPCGSDSVCDADLTLAVPEKGGAGSPPPTPSGTAGDRSDLSPKKTAGGATAVEFAMTVAHAAEHGTRRDLLAALRRRLVEALADERTQPRDLSPLTLRVKELSAEIEAIDNLDDNAFRLVGDQPFDPESV